MNTISPQAHDRADRSGDRCWALPTKTNYNKHACDNLDTTYRGFCGNSVGLCRTEFRCRLTLYNEMYCRLCRHHLMSLVVLFLIIGSLLNISTHLFFDESDGRCCSQSHASWEIRSESSVLSTEPGWRHKGGSWAESETSTSRKVWYRNRRNQIAETESTIRFDVKCQSSASPTGCIEIMLSFVHWNTKLVIHKAFYSILIVTYCFQRTVLL